MSTPSVKKIGPNDKRGFERKSEGTKPINSKTKDLLNDANKPHAILGQLVYKDGDSAGKPIDKADYEVVDPSGKVVAKGTTGFDGMVQQKVAKPGSYTVRVLKD